MSYLEITIIYLTFGASFGVYYFTKHEKESEFIQTSFKSIGVSLLWIPYAFRLFHRYLTNKLRRLKNSEELIKSENFKRKVEDFERRFCQLLTDSDTTLLFEFKETFQRFTGLTLENNQSVDLNGTPLSEISQIVKHESPELFAACLNRRNRNRLEHHQKIAREDLLRFLNGLSIDTKAQIIPLSIEFAGTIGDLEFEEKLLETIEPEPQFSMEPAVKNVEKTVWKTATPKPLLTQISALSLRNLNVKPTVMKKPLK